MRVGDRVMTGKGAGTVAGFWQQQAWPRHFTHVIVALDAGYRRLFPPDQIQVLEEVT